MSEPLVPRVLPEAVQAARQAIQLKGFGGARPLVESLVAENPDEDDLYALLVLLEIWGGNPEEALQMVAERLKKRQSAGVAAMGAEAAHYLAREGDYARYAAIAQSLDPDHFLNLRQRANRHAMESETAEAAALMRRSMEIYPEDADMYASLCNLGQLSGDMSMGTELLENAPDWFRVTSQFHNRAGMFALSKRNMEEAEREMREAVAMSPESGSYWSNLSMILRSLSRYDEAERAAKFAIELNSRNTLALSTMAIVARHRGDDKAAAEWDRKAEEAVPALAYNKVFKKARSLVRAQKPAEAIQFLQKELQKGSSPMKRTARRILIDLLLSTKRTQEARREWSLAIQGDDDHSLKVSEFRLLDQEGRHEEAMARLDGLLAENPIHPDLYAPAISYLIRQDDEVRLAPFVSRLIAEAPGLPISLCAAVHTLAEAKRSDEARALHQAAIRRYPENDALRLLGAVFDAEGGNLRGALHTVQTLPTHLRPRIKVNYGKMLRNPKFWKGLFRVLRNKK